jgi:hypothetical protein
MARSARATLAEIAERPNPARRNRTCPRVVKRPKLKNQLAKRAHHEAERHRDGPAIRINQSAA